MKHIQLFEQFINEKKEVYTVYVEDDREPGGTDKEIKKDYNLTVANRTKDGFDLVGAKKDIEDFVDDYSIIGDIELYEGQLNETTFNNFKPTVLDKKNQLDEKFFKKLMPRTAKNTEEAMERIWYFEGMTMFAHFQYHEVKPNGNKPDRPKYRLHQSQYWLSGAYDNQIRNLGLDPREGVNTTLLTIYDITDSKNEKSLGAIWVNTKEFLEEMPIVFEISKRAM
jgi:hypothetical protein